MVENWSALKVHLSDISAACSWCPLHRALESGKKAGRKHLLSRLYHKLRRNEKGGKKKGVGRAGPDMK